MAAESPDGGVISAQGGNEHEDGFVGTQAQKSVSRTVTTPKSLWQRASMDIIKGVYE
jgi:hypothetical protein